MQITRDVKVYFSPCGSVARVISKMAEIAAERCQACVRKCPRQARTFDDAAFLSHRQMLEQNYAVARRAEYFV